MDLQNIKQPNKFTHQILENQSKTSKQEQQGNVDQHKTKKITKKLNNKKVIKKKFQPSALRLQAINETFHKIQANSNQMLDEFRFNKQLLDQFLNYNSKVKCKCGRNIKYYCLKCMYGNEQLEFPRVELPFKVNVIHHTSQKINKSSIIPMKLLSQQIDIRFYHGHPQQKKGKEQEKPQQLQLGFPVTKQNLEKTYILFPHKKSRTVTKEVAQNIQNLIILDCTWFQTDSIIQELDVMEFSNYIRLENYQSLFWRYNHHSEKALSSAQSLAYFLREYQTSKDLDVKKYDELMFLYCLNLKIISDSYQRDNEPKEEKEEPKDDQHLLGQLHCQD